ncbi:tetratricopeptide repeat protein [Peribacillus sp. SCS-37]|uniref:tetratricopeptide repeat protein n=1 Tax=Paraperibacillus esterisolvens TaxID=3115296 RepID=UPI003905BBE2
MRGKQNKPGKDRKVIPFPGLADRLIDRGLDSLKEKNFKDAAGFFREARELEPEHAEMNVGLVVSLVELGNYREAEEICKELLRKGIGDYFQVVNIYLMILLNLNEHEEMAGVIRALLEEKQVPPDKEEHFYKMLEFCERALEEHADLQDPADSSDAVLQPGFDLLGKNSEQEQLLLISQLAHANIRPYLGEMKVFLKSPERNPFLKTLIITILRDQGVGEVIEIEKFGRVIEAAPELLPDILETDFLQGTVSVLEEMLSHEDPTLSEFARSLVERHNFILYPFEPIEFNARNWAAAYHILAGEYQGAGLSEDEASARYDADLTRIQAILEELRNYEEISYPTI